MRIDRKKSPVVDFFPRFIISLICLQLIVFAIHSSVESSQFVQHTLTQVVAWLYSLLYIEAIVDGNMLIHQYSLNFVIIDNECTGLMLLASVCAAIIALAIRWQDTLKMIMIAVIVLQIENIVRISHLFIEVNKPDNNFVFYHLYFWQAVNFITGLAVFFALERSFNKSEHYV